ncbi:MAG: LLM class flavin-dependent oxidoreductase [Hyphomicrobiales bacterium]
MQQPHFHTVCPFHTGAFGMDKPLEPDAYRRVLAEHVAIAEANGIEGMIIYNFATSLDSLSIASAILSAGRSLRPIVAVSPFHIHPFALARTAASLAYLHGRGIDLNLVKGATEDEQAAVGEAGRPLSGHYARMAEFLDILNALFNDGACDLAGDFYTLKRAALHPPLAAGTRPLLFVPGSSPEAANVIAGRASSSLLMAKPLDAQRQEIARLAVASPGLRQTIIIGICARPTDEEAWEAAGRLYAGNRREAMNARMFVNRAISFQHRSNAAFAAEQELFDDALWYGGAKIGIDCPKLVGSYERVAESLAAYVALGVTDIIIDLPPTLEEYPHAFRAIAPLRTK